MILLQSNFVYAESRLLRVPISSQDGGFRDKFEELYSAEVTIETILISLKEEGKIPQDAKLKKTRKTAYAYGLLSGIYNRGTLTQTILADYNSVCEFREAKQWKLPLLYRMKLLRRIKKINNELKTVFPDAEEITLDIVRFPKQYAGLDANAMGSVDFFFNSIYAIAKMVGIRFGLDWMSLKSLVAIITHEHLHLALPGFPDHILKEGATEYFASKILDKEPNLYFREVDIVRRLVNIVGEDLVKEVYQTGNILLLEEPLGKECFGKMIEIIRCPPILDVTKEDYIKILEALEGLLEARQESKKADIAPKVTIIILHYGWDNGLGKEDTIELLGNLEGLNYSNYEIILIDNNSPDGFFMEHKDSLADEFPGLPKITFIRSDVNLGFAEGNNLGMELASKDEAVNYFFLINNDTILDEDSLANLVKVAESSNDIGVVGSKVYYHDRPNVIANAGSNFFAKPNGYNEEDIGQCDTQMIVDHVLGAAMLVKKEVFSHIGGMKKELFMYIDETEWCMRIKKGGYKSIYAPEAKVWHKERGATQIKFSTDVAYYWTRNKFYIIRHHPERRSRQLIRLVLSTGNSIVRKIINRDIKTSLSILRGFYDGLLGRFSEVERGKLDIVTFNENLSEIDSEKHPPTIRQKSSLNNTSPTDL